MKNYIIYQAYNTITQMSYIGCTCQLLNIRVGGHYHFAFSNRPTASHIFATALREYSSIYWEWYVLDTSDNEDQAYELEQKYIIEYDSLNSGYNSTFGGAGSINRVLSEETKAKIANSHKGKPVSKEARENLSKALKGRVLSEADKKAKSEAARKRTYKSKSGYKNVTLTSSGKYRANYVISRREIKYLGTFPTLDAALKAQEEFKKALERR